MNIHDDNDDQAEAESLNDGLEEAKTKFLRNLHVTRDMGALFQEYTSREDYDGDVKGFTEWLLIKFKFYELYEALADVDDSDAAKPEKEEDSSRLGKFVTGAILLAITGGVVYHYWDQILPWLILVGEWTAGILTAVALIALGVFKNRGGRSGHQEDHSGGMAGGRHWEPSSTYQLQILTKGSASWRPGLSSGSLPIIINTIQNRNNSYTRDAIAIRIVEKKGNKEIGTVWSA